ncbi:hypothetical protein CP985_08600 [Malaciobacter mytili LMG 24559]|uniref:Uncharacterized protein n=2 Tax=Malaciobacter mytili TaxID=603050 RepID=A0AAX2AEU9_9BACT|nr:hypothetical protein CP985_08600 [Malaciobacter mytili LMG 24559]
MSVYKSLYRKVNEEKNIMEEEYKKLENIIERYEKQLKISTSTLKNNQDNLQVARNDLQKAKLENAELRHKIDILEQRTEELYAQVNTMV